MEDNRKAVEMNRQLFMTGKPVKPPKAKKKPIKKRKRWEPSSRYDLTIKYEQVYMPDRLYNDKGNDKDVMKWTHEFLKKYYKTHQQISIKKPKG